MKIEKFMFCIRLETIGLVIGFLGVFSGVFSLLSLICAFFYLLYMLIFSSSEELQHGDDNSGLFTMITVGFIFGIIVVSAITYIHVQLIKGIRNHQHEKMIPWLVVQRIEGAVNLLGMLSFLSGIFPFSYIAPHIAATAFHMYCHMAVHSLYENIKETSEGHVTNEQTAGFSMLTTNDIPEEV